jgi:hypothetical protein
MKSTVVWVVTPCSSARARRFGGMQGLIVSQVRSQQNQVATSKMCKVNVAVKWLAFLIHIQKCLDRMPWKLEILNEDLYDPSQPNQEQVLIVI